MKSYDVFVNIARILLTGMGPPAPEHRGRGSSYVLSRRAPACGRRPRWPQGGVTVQGERDAVGANPDGHRAAPRERHATLHRPPPGALGNRDFDHGKDPAHRGHDTV